MYVDNYKQHLHDTCVCLAYNVAFLRFYCYVHFWHQKAWTRKG